MNVHNRLKAVQTCFIYTAQLKPRLMETKQFCGDWKFVSCDNFDEFLKELGINVVLRKMAAVASPTVSFFTELKEGKDVWTMRTETFVRTVKVEFLLNEPFSETTIDLRKLDSVFAIENGDTLTQIQTDKSGRRAKIERRVKDDIMNVTMTINDVVSTAIFKKV